MILLDSDVLIELLRKGSSKSKDIIEKLTNTGDPDIRIISLVLEEVLFGIIKRSGKIKDNHDIFSFP